MKPDFILKDSIPKGRAL